MSEASTSPPLTSIREVIETFIRGRLQTKLDKLKPDEADKAPGLEESYEPEAWLQDAARRVGQIQLASHILKPIHPDARGTSLRVRPKAPQPLGLLGTWSVPDDSLVDDVVGNAAALDVSKFLNLEFQGRKLLAFALERDPTFLAALSSDSARANEWCSAFAAITDGDSTPASHSLAKQLYFPLPNGTYHLLAPLFPTSLVHAAQGQMREDRFGEAAKAARGARAKKEPFAHGFREYPNLAIQKFGGTKPQNISQLNSERYGENWLLPSLPPLWKSGQVAAPLGCSSVFGTRFGRSKETRAKVEAVITFLEREQRNTVEIRQRRARMIAAICNDAHEFAATFLNLEPGWSADPACELHEAEMHWLDPRRVEVDPEFSKAHTADWPSTVSTRFANWLNSALKSKKFTMDDDTHAQWLKDFQKEFTSFRNELEVERD